MNSRILAKLVEVATEIDYLKSLRRDIERNVYQRELKKLQKKEKSLKEDLEQEKRSREIARQIAIEEERKKKKRQETLAKQRELRKARKDLLFRGISGDDEVSFLKDAYQRISNATTIRIVSEYGELRLDETRQVPDNQNEFVKLFYRYESGSFNIYMGQGGSLMIFKPSNIPSVRLRQMFRQGIEHCVFVPILKKLNDSLANCKSKDSAKRYTQRINKLKDLEALYENGVPEDKMEEVAKASGFKVIIHNIIGKEIMVFNEHGKMGNVRFTNTRPNHVDYGCIALDQDYEKVSENEIYDLWSDAKENSKFYMIEGDIKNGNFKRLKLLDKAYRVVDPNEEYFDKMNEGIELNKYRFNASKYPEVNEFIKSGRIVNSWVCPLTDEKPTGHLDMPKAYTQFKKCAWYSGFLGVIHQWRSGVFDRKWLEEHIGIYRFTVLGSKNEMTLNGNSLSSKNDLFTKLGIVKNAVLTLPSPEILYFMDKGIQVSITAGVWGSKFDFDFPDEMLSDRRYCLWSGRLGMERNTRNFSFHSDESWASHLKSEFGDDCYYWDDKKICSVSVPVKNVMTTHHILAFITSYVRIQMMEAMSKFNVNQIVKVVMDGIYFIGEKPMGIEWFREKEIVEHSKRGFQWYLSDNDKCKFPEMIIQGNTVMTGQGGSGKTYKIMTDKGFNKILFVSPLHVLGADVKEKYDVPYTTVHKLIGEDCQPYILDHPYPPVLFIDEITQIEASWITKIFSMYKDSLIILAGDINEKGQWFQCRNGHPGNYSSIWKPENVEIYNVPGDRRSRDEELKQLKLDIRAVMEKYFLNGDSNEYIIIQRWARKHLNICKFDDAVQMFTPGDCWIAGTHKTNDKLLEKGIVSGWYRKGGCVKYEETEGYDKRGSFTIHAFQGRTVESGKIFISINDLFEYSMLYTAVSRAVHFNQLVFVE